VFVTSDPAASVRSRGACCSISEIDETVPAGAAVTLARQADQEVDDGANDLIISNVMWQIFRPAR
jgi:hypothetical protein